MLDINQINAVAAEVSRDFLPAGAIVEAQSRPDAGSDGEEQLWVLLIVREQAMGRINGENALNTIYHLQQRLLAQGENRFAVVEFASDTEHAVDGGS